MSASRRGTRLPGVPQASYAAPVAGARRTMGPCLETALNGVSDPLDLHGESVSASLPGEREGLWRLDAPFPLHHGGSLPELVVAWRLAGNLSGPIVLVLGGISASRRVFLRDGQGWWNEVVGPGRALDSQRFAILGLDFVGGSGESSGPVIDSWPAISSYDQAKAILGLLDHLGLSRLRAIVGASYGAMVALAFGQLAPSRVERLIVISGADVAHPMASAPLMTMSRSTRDGASWPNASATMA
ncbi:MAG: alpha/beta fold hydrolase, partial [Proteobacteria bacterium]